MDPNFGDHGMYIYIHILYIWFAYKTNFTTCVSLEKKHAVRLTRVLFQHVSRISANREHQVGIPVYPIQPYLGISY